MPSEENRWWNEEGMAYFKLNMSRLVHAAAVTTPMKAEVMAKKLVRESGAGGGTATSVIESHPVPVAASLLAHPLARFSVSFRRFIHLRSWYTIESCYSCMYSLGHLK